MLEGLEQQIIALESSLEDTACILCLEPVDTCICSSPILWPIKHVILKLKARLSEYSRVSEESNNF